MGPLHCADRREEGEEGVTRRWFGAAMLLVLVAAACNGDDDDAVESSVPETTAAPAASPPETTEATTTTESTTTTVEATTTTVDVEAQIAQDYLRVQQALEDLSRNPGVPDLEAAVSAIAVGGSPAYESILDSIRERLATGERLVPGDPDYSDIFVELVEIDPSGQRADVTACVVTNQVRLDANGQPIGAPELFAARIRQTVEETSAGWLLLSNRTGLDIEQGATSCPA
jgi:hypothetical protein